MDNKITICKNHQDYQVPLISTMVFRGAELWCPFCGDTQDMFGGEEVHSTKQLQNRYERYKEFSSAYLMATAVFSASQIKHKGKYLLLRELPKEYVEKQRAIIKDWKNNVEIEAVSNKKLN